MFEQVSLLAEREMIMMLRMQREICERFGIGTGNVRREADEPVKETKVEQLVSELDDKLPSQ